MALTLALAETNVGLPATEAYARIVAFSYDVLSNRVQVAVNVYANQAARLSGKAPIGGGVFEGTVGVDFPTLDVALAQGVRNALYTWLKTQAAFVTATDALDALPAPVIEAPIEPTVPSKPATPIEPPLVDLNAPEVTPSPQDGIEVL